VGQPTWQCGPATCCNRRTLSSSVDLEHNYTQTIAWHLKSNIHASPLRLPPLTLSSTAAALSQGRARMPHLGGLGKPQHDELIWATVRGCLVHLFEACILKKPHSCLLVPTRRECPCQQKSCDQLNSYGLTSELA
jgi:hypothetical protein